MSKKSSRALTKRQPTARSQNVVSHVDAISAYNERLSNILNNEKLKDETMRSLEKQLYADKLKHAELIADVSFGHELMELEEKCDEEYTALEEVHEGTWAGLREATAAQEELSARLTLADIESVMLQQQLQQARVREETLNATLENMNSKLETLKANEKAASARAAASLKRSEEVRAKHSKEFDKRPSNQDKRHCTAEIKDLVGEVQRLRSEHNALMKKLHAKEAHEVKLFEEEAAAKLGEQESKLKAQFSKEELKAIAKHDAYQRELRQEMERLEDKMKAQMEAEEQALRAKIKALEQQRSKSTCAIETMRQQVVDYLAERNVNATQVKHVMGLSAEREKTLEKLTREETALKASLAEAKAAAKTSADRRTKIAGKYSLVVKQNKKMTEEIAKYSNLVSIGETELDLAPANKRIRLHTGKL
mmetsp:Transcript_58185/g.131830  ORF Transcript_58185/g.131830 Transcript_58185/m.131830 type:complete len:422 (+) Transcript_58185:94-1359(+)